MMKAVQDPSNLALRREEHSVKDFAIILTLKPRSLSHMSLEG